MARTTRPSSSDVNSLKGGLSAYAIFRFGHRWRASATSASKTFGAPP